MMTSSKFTIMHTTHHKNSVLQKTKRCFIVLLKERHVVDKQLKIDDSGFTLIEALIALFVLTVGVFSLDALLTVSTRGNLTANQITYSSEWGSNQIENIFSISYNDIRLSQSISSNYISADINHKMVSNDNLYRYYWNVTDDQPLADLKTIQIFITRNDRLNEKTISMKYIKGKYN